TSIASHPGAVDLTFNPGAGIGDLGLSGLPPTVKTIAVQEDGKILIGGRFDFVNGTARNQMARLNADGTVDDNYAPAVPAGCCGMIDPFHSLERHSVEQILLQKSGKAVVVGNAESLNLLTHFVSAWYYAARLNTDGTWDA